MCYDSGKYRIASMTLYGQKTVASLKRILPLSLRRFLKKIILFASTFVDRPLWLFSQASDPSRRNVVWVSDVVRRDTVHVLILIPWLEWGGSYHMLYELVSRLSAQGFSFSLRYTREPTDALDKFKPYVTDIGPLFLNWKKENNFNKVKKLFDEQRPDAVLLIDIDPDSFFFLPHFKHFSIPVIAWLHFDVDTFLPYARFITRMKSFLNLVVVITEPMKDVLSKSDFLGLKVRIEVVNNGIDSEKFSPVLFSDRQKMAYKQELDIETNGIIVSFISRFDDVKNPLAMVSIAQRVTNANSHIYFVLAGDGHLFERTKKMASESGLEHAFRFIGFQSDVRDLLSVSSILIAPSLSESFGLAVAEAMAMEVPVVVSDVGGLKNLVRQSIDGYRCHPLAIDAFSSTIVKLLSDPGKRCQMGKAGRNRIISEFSIEKMVRLFGTLITSI